MQFKAEVFAVLHADQPGVVGGLHLGLPGAHAHGIVFFLGTVQVIVARDWAWLALSRSLSPSAVMDHCTWLRRLRKSAASPIEMNWH